MKLQRLISHSQDRISRPTFRKNRSIMRWDLNDVEKCIKRKNPYRQNLMIKDILLLQPYLSALL